MRKLCVALAAVFCWMSVSCGSGTETPKGTVQAFIDASKAGDEAVAMEFVEKSDREFIKKMQEENTARQDFGPPKDATFVLGEEKIDGDKATVEVATRKDGEEEKNTLNLVRQDGVWKIDLIPDEMKQFMEGLKGMSESLKRGVEEMGESMKEGPEKDGGE